MADGPWAQYQGDAKAAPDGPWSQYAARTPPQMEGAMRLPAMAASRAAKGFAGTLGLPGDVSQSQPENPLMLPFQAIAGATRWGLNKLGLQQPAMVPGEMPTGQQVQQPLQQAGIINRPDLQPQNEGEQILSAASQGAGAALPLGMGGPLALMRAGLAGAGSGVGSYEGQKYGGDAGGIVGGFLGGVGTDAATGLLGKTAGALTGASSAALAPYDRLGIPPRMVGDVTQNPSLQFGQQFAGKMPGGVKATAHAAQSSISDFNGAVENSAAKFGPQDNAQDAGQVLQAQARNWIDNILPAKNNQAFGPVNQLVPQDAPTPLNNYRAMLTKLVNSREGMENTSKTLQNQTAAQLLDDLNKDIPTPRWDVAHGISQDLGDKMGTPEFVQKIGKDNLNKLYGALAQDRYETANNYGAGAYFKQANRIATQNYAIRDNVLSNYVAAKNPIKEAITPDAAANGALRSNNDLQVIRQQMPQAADALAAYEIRKLGFRPSKPDVSPSDFATDLNKLTMSRKQGTQALYGQSGMQDLSDLGTVAQNAKSAQQFANHSGTAGHNIMAHLMSAGGGALLGGGGSAHEIAAAAAGLVGLPIAGRGLAAALTSPRLARLAATPSLAPRALPQGAVPLAVLSSGGALQPTAK